MKKQLALALFLLLSFTTFSQIKFEKGYFISNDNSKTECLIKNYDWDKNPSKINYKLNENDLPKEAAIEEIKEFSIDGISKYERFTVDIDMSSQDLNTMNKDRNPEWEKNTVFLKLLVEGNAKLYRYNNENIPYKYLFSVDSLEVKQLIYKEYLTNRGNKARNLAYIEQLRKYVNCKGKTTDELLRVRYKEVDLRNYFEENNICENPDLENIKTYKKNKGKFNIIITPGINISSFSIGNTQSRRYSTDFDTGINLRIGTELEYVLPFNKNKWSVFIDPNYYSYSSHLEKELYSSFTINTPEKFDVTIKRFAVPFGIRHYFFLNDNVKFFVNAGYSYDMDLGSSIAFEKRNDLDMDATSFSLFGGVGVNFKSKYRAEIRYFSQDYLGDTYTYWYSDFNTISFVVGYNFL